MLPTFPVFMFVLDDVFFPSVLPAGLGILTWSLIAAKSHCCKGPRVANAWWWWWFIYISGSGTTFWIYRSILVWSSGAWVWDIYTNAWSNWVSHLHERWFDQHVFTMRAVMWPAFFLGWERCNKSLVNVYRMELYTYGYHHLLSIEDVLIKPAYLLPKFLIMLREHPNTELWSQDPQDSNTCGASRALGSK